MLKTLFSVGQKNMYVTNHDLNTVYAMNPINKTDYFMPGEFKEL